MSPIFDCRDEAQLLAGMRQARQAIGRGELVVLPTDTVYGVAADAFSAARRAAPARREGPRPPVAAAGARRRASRPCAPSSPRCPSPSSGSSRRSGRAGSRSCCRRSRRCRGTSATRTAPSRCGCRRTASRSSCSRRPVRSRSRAPTSPASRAAITADDAEDMLGDSVAVYLDGGPSATGIASTIIDATSLVGRRGEPLDRACCARAPSTARALREVLGDLLEPRSRPRTPDVRVKHTSSRSSSRRPSPSRCRGRSGGSA